MNLNKFNELLAKIKNLDLPHGALACGNTRGGAIDTELVLANTKQAGSADLDTVTSLCDRIHELEAELDFINDTYAEGDLSSMTHEAIRMSKNARALLFLKDKNKKLAEACRNAMVEAQLNTEISDSSRDRIVDAIMRALR